MRRALGARAFFLVCGVAGCNALWGIDEATGPSTGEAGNAGSSSGSAGSPPGGLSGRAGGAGAGGTSGSGASGGGSGGAGGTEQPFVGLLGQPCTVKAKRACHERASKLVLICDGAPLRWQTLKLCDGLQLCDGRSEEEAGENYASCQEVVPLCTGLSPGAVLCEGAQRKVCGPDLITLETSDCVSPQHCQLGLEGPGCAACLPGEHACQGNVLQTCGLNGLSFVDTETCPVEQPCNAGVGKCTGLACEDGQYRCSGSVLETCNAEHTGFLAVQDCGAQICDAAGKQCDACAASTSGCADDVTASTCSADGQTSTLSTCPISQPHCVGQGQCVTCLQDNECPNPPGPCNIGVCSGGQCGEAPSPDGTSCGGGRICDSGVCVCPLIGGDSAICQ